MEQNLNTAEVGRRRTVLDQARECFESDRCPVDGNLKRAREEFFCKRCMWKLDRKTRAYLANTWPGFEVHWLKAFEGLKKEQDESEAGGAQRRR